MVVVLLYRGHRGYDFSPNLWWMEVCDFKHSTRRFLRDNHEINDCPHQHAHSLVKMSDLKGGA